MLIIFFAIICREWRLYCCLTMFCHKSMAVDISVEYSCALLKRKSVKCLMFCANFHPPAPALLEHALIVSADCVVASWGVRSENWALSISTLSPNAAIHIKSPGFLFFYFPMFPIRSGSEGRASENMDMFASLLCPPHMLGAGLHGAV